MVNPSTQKTKETNPTQDIDTHASEVATTAASALAKVSGSKRKPLVQKSSVLEHFVKIPLEDTNVCDGDYLHVRCCGHILNLVVNDGLKDLHNSISAIRNDVRYVRSSPTRLQRFKDLVQKEKIDCKALVCLDIVTRWNSTYLMLEHALKFQKVFDRMEDEDDGYNVFYTITLRFSGSLYVTSNSCFHDIAHVHTMLQASAVHQDPLIREMAKNMKLKYDKYWGKPENMNPLLVIGVVLDPRYKFGYVNNTFNDIYDHDPILYAIDDAPSFDVLTWWRENAKKYKCVSLIASDALVMPVSVVAFESAFSTDFDQYEETDSIASDVSGESTVTEDVNKSRSKVMNDDEILNENQLAPSGPIPSAFCMLEVIPFTCDYSDSALGEDRVASRTNAMMTHFLSPLWQREGASGDEELQCMAQTSKRHDGNTWHRGYQGAACAPKPQLNLD
ncbi:zinc finger BED domain-containing protein RICESLEEPER 2-like [Senna tora]|uniref:Zinc finger BED domain-containing protein RICESLEEPER 2-like n=1 Tax=Senna tora TaxID=362788 RepID=A0A834W8J6_9FABA|nr:zinc finger BED domain-containing protein RICESLEEPER 2-like [Senna tora]